MTEPQEYDTYFRRDFRHCVHADWEQEVEGMCSCMLWDDDLVPCTGGNISECEFCKHPWDEGCLMLEKI